LEGTTPTQSVVDGTTAPLAWETPEPRKTPDDPSAIRSAANNALERLDKTTWKARLQLFTGSLAVFCIPNLQFSHNSAKRRQFLFEALELNNLKDT
jgi:hypothetical protein